jgi:hypothetical protein
MKGSRYPTLVHPNDKDLSLGTPKPQKQERGEGGAPGSFAEHFRCPGNEETEAYLRKDSKMPEQQSLLQKCLQDMEKRQGTTSVVPNRAKYDSGFSHCGIVSS